MGWKFLDPTLATYYDGQRFQYIAPKPGEKWSEPTWHPDPLQEPDGRDCGHRGLHQMELLSSIYAPPNWWPWWSRGAGLKLGESAEKSRWQGLQIRVVAPRVFARCLRPPFNWGRNANLRWANLRWANLRWANLCGANLCGAIHNENTRWPDGFTP